MREEIFVTKTDAGETLAKKGGLPQTFAGYGKNDVLVIKQGIFRVDEIVENEARLVSLKRRNIESSFF